MSATTTTSRLDKALAWAALGVSVLPTGVDKRPKTEHGIDDATTDPETIKTWWSRWPDAQVAIDPDSAGLVVVDGDVKPGKDYRESLRAAGRALEASGWATPSGGRHFLYRNPGLPLKGGTDVFGIKGLDLRCGGLYAIAYGGVPMPHDLESLADLPVWLRQTRDETVAPFSGTAADWLDAVSVEPVPCEKVAAFIDAIPEWDFGHDEMVTLQATLAGLGRRGHSGVGAAVRALEAAWLREPYDTSGYRRDWAQSLDGAVRKYGGEPDPGTCNCWRELPMEADPVTGEVVESKPERKLKLLRRSDLRNRPKPEWLIDGFLQEFGVVVLAGEPGLGKSFVALDMAARIGTGTSWHGRKTKRARVVYVAAEGSEFFDDRMAAWEQHAGLTIPDDAIEFIEEGFNLSDADAVAELGAIIAEDDFKLVILDTLSQLSAYENENDAAQLSAVIRAAKSIREKNPGATVLLVHHTNKSEKGKVRGSGAIKGNSDAVIVAKSRGEGVFSLSTKPEHDGKQKNGKAELLTGFYLADSGPSAAVAREKVADPDMDAINLALADGEWHGIQEVLSARGHMDEATSKRLRRRMADLPEVEEMGERQSKRYRLIA